MGSGQEADGRGLEALLLHETQEYVLGLGVDGGLEDAVGVLRCFAGQVLDPGGHDFIEVAVYGLGGRDADVLHRIAEAMGQDVGPPVQRQEAQGLVGGEAHVGVGRVAVQQLADGRDGRRVADVAQHIQCMDAQVGVVEEQILGQDGHGLGADADQGLLGIGAQMGVVGAHGLVQFVQGDGILDLGEDVENEQVELVVRAHAFGQAQHGGGRAQLAQGHGGGDDQGPVAGIQEFAHGVGGLRIADLAQGGDDQVDFIDVRGGEQGFDQIIDHVLQPQFPGHGNVHVAAGSPGSAYGLGDQLRLGQDLHGENLAHQGQALDHVLVLRNESAQNRNGELRRGVAERGEHLFTDAFVHVFQIPEHKTCLDGVLAADVVLDLGEQMGMISHGGLPGWG